jgi:hypothetical protein
MHTRFVPPHYQHDFLTKLARLEQDKNYVQGYYQELQTGTICCGIVEDNEAMLEHLFGGLNKEIQHILDYKEYNTITRLFHIACKAELEVQDRPPSWRRANNFTGRTSSWSAHQSPPPPHGDAASPSTSRYTMLTSSSMYALSNTQNRQKSPLRSSFRPLKFLTQKFYVIFTYILLLSYSFVLVV